LPAVLPQSDESRHGTTLYAQCATLSAAVCAMVCAAMPASKNTDSSTILLQ
jgi:hypothetical protein